MIDSKYQGALTPNLIDSLARAQLTPSPKKVLGMTGARSGVVHDATGEWFVCRAPQDGGCARLLDLAVLLRGDRNIPCLAILEAPADKERKLEMSSEFLRAYQSIVWRTFGIALVLDDGERSFFGAEAGPSPEARTEFSKLVAEVETALRSDAATATDGTRWLIPEDSREAEALVRMTINRVLHPKGYRRKIDGGTLGKTYKGFWRGAEADGTWANANAHVKHIALESKLTEDVEAPLCQVVDHLAHVTSAGGGGVVCVRVYRPGNAPHEHTESMTRLEQSALVRYLDVVLA